VGEGATSVGNRRGVGDTTVIATAGVGRSDVGEASEGIGVFSTGVGLLSGTLSGVGLESGMPSGVELLSGTLSGVASLPGVGLLPGTLIVSTAPLSGLKDSPACW
jgi:hypothetical protein